MKKLTLIRAALLLVAGTAVASAQITIRNHDSGNLITTQIVFPDAPANDFIEQTLDVSNGGNLNVLVDPVWAFGLGFSVCCDSGFTLAPGETHQVTLRFSPQAPGNFSGSLQIGSQNILLFARALSAPSFFVNAPAGTMQARVAEPLEISLSSGFSGELPCVLVNNTLAPVSVGRLTATGDWTVSSTASPPFSIPAGGSVAFGLTSSSRSDTLRGAVTVGAWTYQIDVDSNLPALHIQVSKTALNSGDQVNVSVAFDRPPQFAISGVLDVTLSTSFDVAVSDAAVLFPSTGATSASFSSTAGEVNASFAGQSSIILQTGTTAGLLKIHAKWGFSEDQVEIPISRAPISIETLSATRGSGEIDVTLTGFDNTRSAGQFTFSFFDSKGAFLGNPISANATQAFYQYFFTQESSAGGMFKMQAKFPVTGDVSVIDSIQVDAINGAGDSQSPVTKVR